MTHDNALIVCHNQALKSLWVIIMLEIQGECELEANREKIWPLLFDPETLITLIPGCLTLEEVEQGYYRGQIHIGIAGIGGTYDTSVRVVETNPPEYCLFSGEVIGKSGLITGKAEINLIELNSTCRIKYQVSGIITGALSKFNSRYVENIAQSFIKLGLSRLDQKIVSP